VVTHNGKMMALDHEPDRRYVIQDPTKNPMLVKQRNTYTCHFDTCTRRPHKE
jgi:hypothetical protein